MKKSLALLLTLVLCAMMTPALAANLAPASDASSSSKSPRWEETEWQYRVYNGQVQKRLWSITRGIWLTDWENI